MSRAVVVCAKNGLHRGVKADRFFCALAVLLAGLSLASAQSSEDGLSVTNGDFSDLTGLQERADGWYSGVPAGWTTQMAIDGSVTHAIRRETGDLVANVSVLSQTQPSFVAFEQEVGRLEAPGEVTLTFELKEPWHEQVFHAGAAIYDALATSYPLAVGDFKTTGTHMLTASNVPAGTQIKIGFWSVTGFPALDNVTISVKLNE
jgi:hypothetical protein